MIDDSGLESAIYNGDHALRIYVKTDGTRKGKDCGWVQLHPSGQIEQRWTKRRFDLERIIAEFGEKYSISPIVADAKQTSPTHSKDDDERAFKESAEFLAARESARELG